MDGFSPVTPPKAGSLKMNTALEYSTRVVQEGGRRCKKSTLNDLVHLTPLRIPLMNPPLVTDMSSGREKHHLFHTDKKEKNISHI